MAYCRLEDTARHHLKFTRLATALGIRRAEARGLFLGLCSWATTQAPDGLLVSMTQTDVEHAADWQGKPGRLFPEMVNVGLIDVIDANTFEIHDYFERAASRKEAIKKRQQRARPGTDRGTVPGQSPPVSPGRERSEEKRGEEREILHAQQQAQDPGDSLHANTAQVIPPALVKELYDYAQEVGEKVRKLNRLPIELSTVKTREAIAMVLAFAGSHMELARKVIDAFYGNIGRDGWWQKKNWVITSLADHRDYEYALQLARRMNQKTA